MKPISIAAQLALCSIRGHPRLKHSEPSYFRYADMAYDEITPTDPDFDQLVHIIHAIQLWGPQPDGPSDGTAAEPKGLESARSPANREKLI